MKFVDWLMPTVTADGVIVIVESVGVVEVVLEELPPQASNIASRESAANRAAGASQPRRSFVRNGFKSSI